MDEVEPYRIPWRLIGKRQVEEQRHGERGTNPSPKTNLQIIEGQNVETHSNSEGTFHGIRCGWDGGRKRGHSDDIDSSL